MQKLYVVTSLILYFNFSLSTDRAVKNDTWILIFQSFPENFLSPEGWQKRIPNDAKLCKRLWPEGHELL